MFNSDLQQPSINDMAHALPWPPTSAPTNHHYDKERIAHENHAIVNKFELQPLSDPLQFSYSA